MIPDRGTIIIVTIDKNIMIVPKVDIEYPNCLTIVGRNTAIGAKPKNKKKNNETY